MGQLLRIPQAGEPWQLITAESQERASLEVYSSGFSYHRFRVIHFRESNIPWEESPKEHTIPGRYSTIDEKSMKRYLLEDGLYLLQWTEVGYRDEWKPIRVCQGSYWKVLGGCFEPVRVSPDKIQNEYEIFKEQYSVFERRKRIEIIENNSDK